LIGEYSATRTDSRLVRFEIDYRNRLLSTTKGVATAVSAVQHDLVKIQGAATIRGKYFLTQSAGSHRGNLVTFTWSNGQEQHNKSFPRGPEDLSCAFGKELWTLTEPSAKEVGEGRHVFAFDATKF
jgi:hypothetical protein